MELSMWFVSTCFFGFILSHLIADLLFHHREELYHFMYFLILAGFVGISYCEVDVRKFHLLSNKAIFEIQGRILSFEILFIMILLFVMNH